MFRRVEFQAAAVALVVVGVLLGLGWFGVTGSESDRLSAHLGVLPADVVQERYGADSDEARAYGEMPEYPNAYLVTVTMRDRASGERVEEARVTATVSRLGLTGATKQLLPAELAGSRTYGNYFRMREPGIYNVDVRVERPGVSGNDLVSLEYHRPTDPQ
ncbi:MAG: hypothetical protein U5K43_07480 [Halofilum sp. (in: g-proteobacteria)]|nr:hypothetical protein [Halofilum sp. (in: g-proteobacteria)]